MFSPLEFKEKMKEIAKFEEEGHRPADKLMCEVLKELGFKEGIEIFENMDKWYE